MTTAGKTQVSFHTVTPDLAARRPRSRAARSRPARTVALALTLLIVGGTIGNAQQPATQQPATQQPATQQPAPDAPQRLVVATRNVPPFAMKDAEGNWTGIAIELLREIIRQTEQATGREIELELRDTSLKSMLKEVEEGKVDMAVAALTINLEREKVLDFSHPFHSSGLGIAVAAERGNGWTAVLERVFSRSFFEIALSLFGLLLLSGTAVYFFERRANREHFGGGFWRGLGSGLWWSIVTLTTVGYGDKAPKTLVGRVIAVVWMLSGLLIISSFTAAVTAALTVGELRSRIAGPRDLNRVAVATVADSTSESYLRRQHIASRRYADVQGALGALADGQVGAVVYDAPILRYQVFQSHAAKLRVLPFTFERQDYAIALPPGSPLREQVNQVLLRVISRPDWEDTLAEYLGNQSQ